MNTIAISLALLALTLPVGAQELDLSFLKGLEAKASESNVVDLGPEQLGLMKSFLGGDKNTKNELTELAAGIQKIVIRNFEFDKEGAYSFAEAQSLRDKIKADKGWVSIVSHKERDGSFSDIMMHRGPNGQSDGMLIFSAEKKELSLVNIVGNIDLSKLGKLSGNLGIPKIEMGPSNQVGGKKGKQEEN
jgi:hypothetical protein